MNLYFILSMVSELQFWSQPVPELFDFLLNGTNSKLPLNFRPKLNLDWIVWIWIEDMDNTKNPLYESELNCYVGEIDIRQVNGDSFDHKIVVIWN